MNSKEAEATKLFSNTFLAMRVSYFNEIDTFAETNGLNTKNIIDGMCSDPRIGNYYNNPSFGYGGYCLPKDIKQLEKNYGNIPQKLISATINSNSIRKKYITEKIIDSGYNVVVIYRLIMKNDSSNFRNSAILEIIHELVKNGVKVVIYEPLLTNKSFMECKIENNFDKFKKLSEIILANRLDNKIRLNIDCNKLYTRDIYNNN